MMDIRFFIFGYLIIYLSLIVPFYLLFKYLCNSINDSDGLDGLLCYDNEIRAMKRYGPQFSFVLAITWPISWFFLCGCCIGSEIYTNRIIKGNEEIRIASWLV